MGNTQLEAQKFAQIGALMQRQTLLHLQTQISQWLNQVKICFGVVDTHSMQKPIGSQLLTDQSILTDILH